MVEKEKPLEMDREQLQGSDGVAAGRAPALRLRVVVGTDGRRQPHVRRLNGGKR